MSSSTKEVNLSGSQLVFLGTLLAKYEKLKVIERYLTRKIESLLSGDS